MCPDADSKPHERMMDLSKGELGGGSFVLLCAGAVGNPPMPWAELSEAVTPTFVEIETWMGRISTQLLGWVDPDGEMVDAPTRTWPLSNLSTAVIIVCAYILFVLLGTAAMSVARPIRPYSLIFCYRAVQIVLGSYICLETSIQAWRNGYTVAPCQHFDTHAPLMARVVWLSYISKILDFADTFFLIIGKKWRQLSFSHLYHRLAVFLLLWLNLNAGYDGDIYLLVILTGAVRVHSHLCGLIWLHFEPLVHQCELVKARLRREIVFMEGSLRIMQYALVLGIHVQSLCNVWTKCAKFPARLAQVNFAYTVLSLVLSLAFSL